MVTFIEMHGDGAAESLRTLQADCLERSEACELLVGREQRDVYLLVCRGPGPAQLPEGEVRRWAFDPVDGGGA
jgi:hypothetical protein